MSATDLADRRFQLWEYRVSHGALLIRSPKGPGVETNIDLVFSGVEYVECPRMLRGVELATVTPEDVRRAGEAFGPVVAPDQLFVLLSAGIRHLVVAASCHVSENMDDIFDIPLI
jgi:hypothetical protein